MNKETTEEIKRKIADYYYKHQQKQEQHSVITRPILMKKRKSELVTIIFDLLKQLDKYENE